MPEAYSDAYQRSKMECFAKRIHDEKLLNIFANGPSSMFNRVLNTLLDADIHFFTYFKTAHHHEKEGAR